MSDVVKNSELTPENIPQDNANWSEIAQFALTFDGYDYWGSFGECAELANQAKLNYDEQGILPDTLTVLRSCLFFEQRRWRHYGYSPNEKDRRYIYALVGKVRYKIVAQDFD